MTTTPRGIWLGASRALDRPAPTSQPYPCICHCPYVGFRSRRVHTVQRNQCAADHPTRTTTRRTPRPAPADPTQQLPPVDDDAREIDARKTGDH